MSQKVTKLHYNWEILVCQHLHVLLKVFYTAHTALKKIELYIQKSKLNITANFQIILFLIFSFYQMRPTAQFKGGFKNLILPNEKIIYSPDGRVYCLHL